MAIHSPTSNHFDQNTLTPYDPGLRMDVQTTRSLHYRIYRLKVPSSLSLDLVGRATLNKTVLHLTGLFACLLREYDASDGEILHADMIGEIELLAKELSSLLSQLMGLSNAVYSLYSKFNSTAAAEADLLRPSILKDTILLHDDSAYGMTARRPDQYQRECESL